jgi:hypothetical protein
MTGRESAEIAAESGADLGPTGFENGCAQGAEEPQSDEEGEGA